jgi:BirA family transcriptional regulator, biotin operon repressor / biotin---[acetyl-CoA-carboxylase] ligase
MKSLTFAVLRLLADGEFHSGEDLAHKLDISRASICNALKEVDKAGLNLFKIRGRGYRLAEPLQWLDTTKIASALRVQAGRFNLELIDCADSTNTLLMQKAALGAVHGSVIAAELQKHGRGRRGRSWHADLGGALTFSLLWRFNQGMGFLSGLSLAVGVALLRALKSLGVDSMTLKWPNDVLHHNCKLAGILIEAQGDVLGPSFAVIGIGINLKLSERTRELIGQPATDLYSITGVMPERNLVLGCVLGNLAQVLDIFTARGFGGLREEWVEHHAYHNKNVRIMLPDNAAEEGMVTGVDNEGALLIKTRGGERRYSTGEISLRAKGSP